MRIDMRPAALACANEACRNMSGVLDLDAMVRHFEKLGGLPTNPFVVGPATMERVFRAAGLTDLSDMQAVLNAVEAALSSGPAGSVIEAVRGITDDYMTSEAHHPGYVLIPTVRFDMLRKAEASLASAPAGDHPDDVAVDRFAAAMKTKLAKARDKGRGGWDDPMQCTVGHLRDLMHDHLTKGDPIDVANFCMMLFHRGGSTSAPAMDVELREALQQIADKGPEKGSGESYKAWSRTIARRALARPRAAVGGWVPQIGERVEVNDGMSDVADWRALSLWVAGLRVHDSGDGLDVTVSEQWPIPSRVSGRYMGQTDDFRVGASSVADMLRPLQPPKGAR